MRRTFAVLRGQKSPLHTGGWQPEALAFAAGKLTVDIEELNPAEFKSIMRADDTLAAAPAMPMGLIEPVSIAPASAEETGPIAWGVQAVQADTSPQSGSGVVVAVLDSGIDGTHPAFTGVELVQRNFTQSPDHDESGHGTHCAGIIFGRDVQGTRIGIARGIRRALIGKVIGEGQNTLMIPSAILWALQNGAQIISMSLGIDFARYAASLEDEGLPKAIAISRALEGYRANVRLLDSMVRQVNAASRAALIVAAAGNESRTDVDPRFEAGLSLPAACEGVLSVAAVGRHPDGLAIAPFSNTGALICAPGVDIVSAAPGAGLASRSGTSMATPHVAGVAALWAERLSVTGMLSTPILLGRLTGMAQSRHLRQSTDMQDFGAGLVTAPQP